MPLGAATRWDTRSPDEHVQPTSKTIRQSSAIGPARLRLQRWVQERQFSGYEPYDLLNSPLFRSGTGGNLVLKAAIIQFGRRVAGLRIRRWLRVPVSQNPKALGLFLVAYCDLSYLGEDSSANIRGLKVALEKLRSPDEPFYCWGYDWNFVSLRGTVLKKFGPNSIATCFCAEALLNAAELTRDEDAAEMAESSGRFIAERLNRSVETSEHVCFSYTPEDRTRIFNNSALAGALLARLGMRCHNSCFLDLAGRSMQYLADHQKPDGSWTYGEGRWQGWIDGFHTGYNLCALLQYQQATGDSRFQDVLERGYWYYKEFLISKADIPKYYPDRDYPIDIHACSQAILTFSMFADRDPDALRLAQKVANWTIRQMQRTDGAFCFQRHRWFTNPTPYMRWGQAWMFRALAHLELTEYRAAQNK